MDILLRFKNPLVIQLMAIAIVSLATAQEASDTAAAVIVGMMVVLSVGLGFFQERRSGRAVEKLQEMVETSCVVIRDGKEEEIRMDRNRARRPRPAACRAPSSRRTCVS